MCSETLKDAIYETIHHSKIPLKAIADDLGLAESTVNRWGLPDDDPDSSRSRMALRYLVPLIRSTQNHRIIECLCRKLGGYFVKAPAPGCSENDLKTILKAQQEIGSWTKYAAEAMLDGLITDDELVKLTTKLDEAATLNESLKLILSERSKRGAA